EKIVVGAAERDREVGFAHPSDAKAGGRIEHRRVEAALVHDAEPRLGVVHVASEPPAERTVPPVLRIVGAAARPVAALTLPPFEVGTELFGRLCDVAIGIDDGDRSPWFSHLI